MRTFLAYFNSYEELLNAFALIIKAQNLDLDEYIDLNTIRKILTKGYDPEFFFNLAKDFKNFKLYEDEQGNFAKLRELIDIPQKDIQKIVDIMIFTKNEGFPLKQKAIIKYYDCQRPASEDITKLKDAWIYAKKHNIDISIQDFIQSIKYKRDPLKFVENYDKILKNDIPISFSDFKNFYIDQNKIAELIGLLIKAKLANIFLEFSTIYDDIKLNRNVWDIIKYLIKFHDSGFINFSYQDLRNYAVFGGDLNTLHNAFIYNKKLNIIPENELFKKSIEILLVKNKELKFNSLLMIKALELAKKSDFDISPEEVHNDYLAGYDVFNILNNILYAKKHNIEISYNIAKLLEKQPNGFSNILFDAMNPILLKSDQAVQVTTKDNIEIKIEMMIEATIQLKNFFKGSGQDVLFRRANAIFIDEVQRKYNHDEIIMNIEHIANNILYRLNNESRDRKYVYIPNSQMLKIDNENNIEEKEIHTEKPKISDEYNNEQNNSNIKFIDTSKYKPLKVLIPRIDFVKDTFKEFDKAKEEFEIHRKKAQAEIEKIKAEIDVQKAWAKGDQLKYLILKDDNKNDEHNRHIE
jgi:uncharacterized protein YqfA (UPF0365 family)